MAACRLVQATTRERILSAAAKLFYGEGIRAVSVDAVAAKAGVTKRTLYYHFTSKDDLVAAYLAARDQPNLTLFKRWFAETSGGAPPRCAASSPISGALRVIPNGRAVAFCAPRRSSPTCRAIRRSRSAPRIRKASRHGCVANSKRRDCVTDPNLLDKSRCCSMGLSPPSSCIAIPHIWSRPGRQPSRSSVRPCGIRQVADGHDVTIATLPDKGRSAGACRRDRRCASV